MKKRFALIIAFASMLIMSSCTKEEKAPVETTVSKGKVVFVASIDPATRTVLATGNKVEWLAGDVISVFDGKTNRSATTEDSGATAGFELEMQTDGPWYALYPYSASALIKNSSIHTSLPAVQAAQANTFADDLNIAVALSDSNNKLAFKNVLGLLKFELTSTDIASITLYGNDSEVLAGDIAINYNSGNPSWTSENPKRSIQINPSGEAFAAGTYYIAVLPQTFAHGVSFTFKKSNGTYKHIKSTKSLALGRSTIKNLQSIETKIADDSEAIVFADADVKAALLAVSSIDANNDDEISYAEAAAVSYTTLYNIVGDKGENAVNLWGDLSKIDSFDELQYFTGFYRTATEVRLPALFRGCTNLKSVVLPPNTIRIANFAFNGCSSLEHIDFPEGLETIYGSSFIGCTSLKEVIMPNTIISISASAFDGCTSLEKLVISENLTQINNTMFRNAKALKYVYIPDNVTTIGNNVFYGCSALDTVAFSEAPKLQSIGDFSFKGCTSLKMFYLPSANVIKTLGKEVFYENTAMKIRTRNFHSLTSLGESAFYKTAISNITLDNSGLTTIPSNCFNQCTSIQNVYVSGNVTTIGEYAFYGCINLRGFSDVAAGQTGIKIPSGVTRIEQYTFANCRYCTTLSLPEGLTFIGDRSLRSCKFTGDIELPSTLTEISARAFECTDANQSTMSTFKVKATTPPTVTAANGTVMEIFLNVHDLPSQILVPAASVEAYKNATGWSIYADKIVGF